MNESVKKWMDELTADPSTAIHKLVLGYAGVTAWSRSSLRESFVEIFQIHAGALDAAVADWLQDRLKKPPPDKTPELVWASHLQDLFSAIAGLPLPQVARLLRDRLRDFRSWLHPLQTNESLDPEAAYLAALAWADTNQNLEDMWHGLVLRLDCEPDYYTDIGLLGLRKVRDDRGQLPTKAPFLLLATLIDLADTNNILQKDWLLTTRALLGGYHYSTKTWVREFKPVLQARQNARNGPKWLKKVLPELHAEQLLQHRSRHFNQPTRSLEEVNKMVREVEEHGPQALGESLAAFVDRQRAYAKATSRNHNLVRTFNRLANAARLHDTDWATARIREALAWDEDNAYNWTVYASCLWTRGFNEYRSGNIEDAKYYCLKAISTMWTAQYRFWGNDVVSNQLGRLYREAGDLQSAELIYREAIERFPRSAANLVGLARVLVDAGDPAGIEEAITILQRNLVLFPDEYHSYIALARIYEDRFKSTGDKTYEKEMNELRIKGDDLRVGPSRNRFAHNKQEPVPVLKRPSSSTAVADSPEVEGSTKDSSGSADLESKHTHEPADRQQESLHKISLEDTRDRDSERQYVLGVMASSGDQTPIGSLGSQEMGKEAPNELFSGAEKDMGASELDSQNVNYDEDREPVPMAMPDNIDLGPEQRLGLALLFQWRARRLEPGEEREQWFIKAHELLNFPDESAGISLPVFVEARGFLMLARDQVTEAVGYFEMQIGTSSPPPLGLCLGLAQARARLGVTVSEAEESDLDSRVQYHCRGSILPLVLKVIRLLELTLSDQLLSTALIELYPKAKEVLDEFRSMPNNLRTTAQDQDLMISQLIDHYLFLPAKVQSVSDIQLDGIFSRIRMIGRNSRDGLQSVYEKVALAI